MRLKRYHKDKKINQKINALILYFSMETTDKSINDKICVCNYWIQEFILFNEFECAASFRDLKRTLLKRRAKPRHDARSFWYIIKMKFIIYKRKCKQIKK